MDFQELLDQEDTMVHEAGKVMLVFQDMLVSLVLQVLRVMLVFQDTLVLRENPQMLH